MIRIGDFAKIFDVSIKTIRFYEEKKLLHPCYVDIYTGYRYYDEKNIEEMSNILAYKELGFELSEIKNISNETISNKIEKYKNRISKMNIQINTLDSLLKNKERGNFEMKTFINDENAIGKWKLVGVSNSKEDYLNNVLINNDVGIKELYLMENGLEYWVISWSKDIIYINNKPYKYEIDGNLLYLYLNGLFSDENMVAVYERVDNKHYNIDEIKHLDDTNVPFVKDEELTGLWNSIGLVDELDNFNLDNMETNGIYLKNLSVFPEGNVNLTFVSNKTRTISYTKGYIKDMCFDNTMSAYKLYNFNNKTYLVVEWKSGDYVFGGFVNCCYVFKKI